MCNNPCIIAFLETRSEAPTPSTERMVADSSKSVIDWRRATHSHPARVLRAYWNGAMATCPALANCCANVRATNRRNMSLTTIPRMPPDGFFSCHASQTQCRQHSVKDFRTCEEQSPTSRLTPREGTNVPRSFLTDLEPRLGVLTGRSWRTSPRPTGCARLVTNASDSGAQLLVASPGACLIRQLCQCRKSAWCNLCSFESSP